MRAACYSDSRSTGDASVKLDRKPGFIGNECTGAHSCAPPGQLLRSRLYDVHAEDQVRRVWSKRSKERPLQIDHGTAHTGTEFIGIRGGSHWHWCRVAPLIHLGEQTRVRLGEHARIVIDRYLVDAGGELGSKRERCISIGPPERVRPCKSVGSLWAHCGARHTIFCRAERKRVWRIRGTRLGLGDSCRAGSRVADGARDRIPAAPRQADHGSTLERPAYSRSNGQRVLVRPI